MENKQNTDVKTIFDFLRITPLVSIGLGFVFTAFYFMSIGYFPQNDINSFVSIFVYVTILLLVIVGFIPFLSYISVIFWVRNTFSDPNMSRWLLNPDEIESACLVSLNNKTDEPNQTKKITLKILSYYAVSMAPLLTAILVVTSLLPTLDITTIITITGLISFSTSLFYSPKFAWDTTLKNQESIKKYISSTRIDVKQKKFQHIQFIIKYSINTLTSALILSSAISLFLALSRNESVSYHILITLMLLALSSSWFSYITESKNQLKAHLIIVVTFFMVVLMLTQGKTVTTALSLSKLGSFNASIFVKYDTCTMFKKLGKKVECNKAGLTMIDDVTVKWRGADEYVTFKTDTPTTSCPIDCKCAKTETTETKLSAERYLIIPSSEIHGMGSQLT